MDILGIKENSRNAGLSKNYKKNPEDYTPAEKEIDDLIVVDFVPGNGVENDHYIASIPWKDGVPKLENNMNSILNRQKHTNYGGYLQKKGTDILELDKIFQAQLDKGYIEEVTDIYDINRKDSYLIPYFPVVDRIRDTTKVRIVFDAAAKDRHGLSLNSVISKGPNRLNDLYPILLRFRQHRYALQADVSEMFLRCRIKKEDRKYHRFYWNGKIWQWTRTMFGNRASPDITQKIIYENAMRHKDELPLAAECAIRDVYMDDGIKSIQQQKLCVQLALELIKLFGYADMKIVKFYTNSVDTIKALPPDVLSAKVHIMEDNNPTYESSKVLGMVWDASTDSLKFISKFKTTEDFFAHKKLTRKPTWTKRLILQLSATVYDPTGLICPFTVRSRSIIQELWRNKKLTWDTTIPDEDAARWSQWLEELFQLQNLIEIPRFLEFEDGRDVEIHVFVDASSKAYAACAYARVTQKVIREQAREEEEADEKVIAVQLITARARVTPGLTESISKLELASCCMGSRLGNGIARAYDMDPDKIQYWTDSTNCLFWINAPSSTQKVFVANRVGEIQTDTKPERWRHVPTLQNPADIPTRFPSIKELSDNPMWFNGPEFLQKPRSEWPPKFTPPPDDECKQEFKKQFQMLFNEEKSDKTELESLFALVERTNPSTYSQGSLYNGLEEMIPHTARLMRYISQRIHGKSTLTYKKSIQTALMYHIRKSQREDPELSEMIEALRNKSSKVKHSNLSPFLDQQGTLRAKTRLSNIDFLPFHTKCPAILSTKSEFTKMIVKGAHAGYEHTVGIKNAKSKLKNSYFIIGLESLLRTIRAECMKCKKKRAEPYEQKMANLPSYRFEQPLHAFAKVGIDFAGPFELKMGPRIKRTKTYILLFTCLQTRALHLEATVAMDTKAVVLALTSFVALRGMPTDILSDNWKTFVSPDLELQSWVRSIDVDAVITSTKANVEWHFTPPHGPHHGGVYEIMVKATKRALNALFRRPSLDPEEFRTALYKIASYLNDRPLTRTVSDGTLMTLTPNHFLLGKLGGAVHTERLETPEKLWTEMQKMVKIFWKSFVEDYISELKFARQWKHIKPNVEVGDLVIEMDPNLPQGSWKLAVVRQVFPSKDGLVRTVKIENQKNLYTRPITVLCPLDVNVNNDQEKKT